MDSYKIDQLNPQKAKRSEMQKQEQRTRTKNRKQK